MLNSAQPPNSAPTKPAMRRRSALEILSQWFWSAWTISNSETYGSLVESFDVVDNSYLFAPSIDDDDDDGNDDNVGKSRRAQIREHCQADVDEGVPCKGCRVRGVVCDGRRPRCSHCLKEQVLCFYVAPLRKSGRSKSAHLTFEQAQLHAQLRDA
ncbi:hypothetical protein PHISP_03830 [Aspergillus sp. HF37]|nr:hypothetical protein PHISP_03830 [Aspergillus sp. HF37]